MNYNIPELPSELQIHRSIQAKCDHYFKPPPIVQVFIDRFNQENVDNGAVARLWSIPRLVSITHKGEVLRVAYDVIEDDIVKCLAYCRETVQKGVYASLRD